MDFGDESRWDRISNELLEYCRKEGIEDDFAQVAVLELLGDGKDPSDPGFVSLLKSRTYSRWIDRYRDDKRRRESSTGVELLSSEALASFQDITAFGDRFTRFYDYLQTGLHKKAMITDNLVGNEITQSDAHLSIHTSESALYNLAVDGCPGLNLLFTSLGFAINYARPMTQVCNGDNHSNRNFKRSRKLNATRRCKQFNKDLRPLMVHDGINTSDFASMLRESFRLAVEFNTNSDDTLYPTEFVFLTGYANELERVHRAYRPRHLVDFQDALNCHRDYVDVATLNVLGYSKTDGVVKLFSTNHIADPKPDDKPPSLKTHVRAHNNRIQRLIKKADAAGLAAIRRNLPR